MFGFNTPKKEAEPQANPRFRSGIYGMAALYLLYLCCKIVWPYLTRDPEAPTTLQFVLGTVILGGGGIVLGVLAWKMYKASKELLLAESSEGGDPEELPEEDEAGDL